MLGNRAIARLIVLVLHDKDHVKPAENRGLEVNVLAGRLQIVITAPHGIRSRQHRRSAVEHGRYASLCNRDRLLLHCLMDCNAVLVAHLVKLINTDDSTVGQHHSTTF